MLPQLSFLINKPVPVTCFRLWSSLLTIRISPLISKYGSLAPGFITSTNRNNGWNGWFYAKLCYITIPFPCGKNITNHPLIALIYSQAESKNNRQAMVSKEAQSGDRALYFNPTKTKPTGIATPPKGQSNPDRNPNHLRSIKSTNPSSLLQRLRTF